MQLYMTRALSPPQVDGYYGYGWVGGRFYVNYGMTVELRRSLSPAG
jgi:hypothetical protein